jgi:hypothetical protein
MKLALIIGEQIKRGFFGVLGGYNTVLRARKFTFDDNPTTRPCEFHDG